ncbi:HNH endonuclease [Turicimonas muris]|uniref:HNH endonuclease n=2 Tax=Turicimonas muris TaxID=1796652 RepID=UPI0026F2A52E|nr:HNH endonuclease [Turicimonas muris]
MVSLKTLCSWPGCRHLAVLPDRYCEKHKPMAEEKRKKLKEQRQRYKGTSSQRGYNSAWRKARLAFLMEHPLCAECERQGKTTVATCVDHIKPHRGDMNLFWDESNWQSLCQSCHSRKTAKEDGGFGNGKNISPKSIRQHG